MNTNTIMDFSFNEEQLAIQSVAARVFTDLCDDAAIKKLANQDAPSTMHKALWVQLAKLGTLGLPIDEQYGGMGVTLLELCLVLEQQGRTVAPLPLLATLVECAMTLNDSDNDELKRNILPTVAAGNCILSPVRPYTGIHQAQTLKFLQDADGYKLFGRSGFAAYAGLADGYIISGETANGKSVLAYLPSDTEGINVVEQTAINDEPAGYLTFSNVGLAKTNILACDTQAAALVTLQRQRTWVAMAAMQVGILDEGLKRVAQYVSERKQFGKLLGEFQAVSQQAADAYMEVESLRSAYWRALDDIEQDNDLAMSATVARFWVSIAGHKAAHAFLHLHGGIGQDLDYPIHRYFLWAKQNERYLGTPDKLALQMGDTLINNLDYFFV